MGYIKRERERGGDGEINCFLWDRLMIKVQGDKRCSSDTRAYLLREKLNLDLLVLLTLI